MKHFASAALMLLGLPAVALADPFSDFRIPDHSWRSGFLGSSVSGWRATSGGQDQETRQSALSSSLNTSLFLARDSDRLQHELGLRLSGNLGGWDRNDRETYPGYAERTGDSRSQSARESWQLSGFLSAYPWEMPLGFGLSGSGAGSYRQALSRENRREQWFGPPNGRREGNYDSDQHEYAYEITLSAFAGLGRVRDASVVYDAWVLEERLRETGAITRPLSKQAREKLASLYFIGPRYGSAHDRPDRYAWRDMERILREDGALGERGLDPYSLLRVREPYARLWVLRMRGWFAGPVLDDRHSHWVWRDDLASSTREYQADSLVNSATSIRGLRDVTSFDDVNLGAQAEYHLPMGWRWQFDVASRVTVPVRPGWSGLHASTNAQAAWLIADRWGVLARLSHFRDILERDRGDRLFADSWSASYGAQLSWYVEDHVQLGAALWEMQGRSFDPSSWNGRFARSTQLQVGFSYRFLGALDAPGLIEPVRRLP
ncbi:MAG: hypothetical protein HZC42_10920 [Candidatus Eisenbacteria bacterium]|nr:hypothetical protein [Candidatus Eisenbacteria bacterium]